MAVTEPYVWPFNSLFDDIEAGFFTVFFGKQNVSDAKAAVFDNKNYYLKMNGKCFY